jgi:hypothetical protein
MAIQKERRATPRKPGTKPAKALTSEARVKMSTEQIQQLIAETAYFKAKERGFAPGYELEDWIQAEAEVQRRLGAR